ncbi:ribosome hibernation-promoting factor, HPF/YfiA family [Lichenifustis flavocetrariae]|uniref:Ribosome hibernation promoting factor n=1 Tax=Lichenifustis flavocetrariae TaxID=2949735 RepID=A0AA42CJC3_9HYPH|nr:ribosome-associated translation inhibitor RaiA [Lichenifustis flavocetrariae]MCW6507906.1 ribosome-associated translation inhibitor RaiA [Lichenifustis flavocetrariae]
MTLRVSGKNLTIGEALQDHARTRITTAVGRYFDGPITGHVTIETEGSGYRSDLTLHLTSGTTLQVEGRAHEPYPCFDQAADKLERRLRRYKSKLRERHPGSGVASLPLMPDRTIEQPDQELDAVGYSPVIVAETKKPLTAMSVAAAVSELDLSGAPVLVFRHSGNDHVNIVYRRTDGHIGWIDPYDLES